jgi:hypothetical protein
MDHIFKSLKAAKFTKHGVTTSFAVPHPTLANAYAQVDAHECLPGRVTWEAWSGGYGDLVQILGVMNRPLGLTMNDKGLYVRLKEIEPTNRKASMIFLTDTPEGVCEFLGLDRSKWLEGFNNLEEIFKWCANGTFYGWVWNQGEKSRADGIETKNTSSVIEFDHKTEDSDAEKDKASFGDDKTVAAGGTVTSNDRARFRKRPMFKQFFRKWLPENKDAFRNEWPVEREKVLEAALNHFGARSQYDDVMAKCLEEERQKQLLDTLRDVIPEKDKKVKEAIRGMKRWTKFENGKPTFRDSNDPADVTKLEWLWKLEPDAFDELVRWVAINHRQLRKMEEKRVTDVIQHMAKLNLMKSEK